MELDGCLNYFNLLQDIVQMHVYNVQPSIIAYHVYKDM